MTLNESQGHSNWYQTRPAYTKILVSTQNSLCPYFKIFLPDFFFFFFFVDAPPIKQNNKVSKDTFSVIHLVRRVRELTFSIILMHAKLAHYEYDTWMPFFFCLHLLKLFWSKTAKHFLQKQCTVCAAFADADTSFLEWLLSDQNLFPWFLVFFLFFGFVQPLVTDSFELKPAISEDG